MSGDATQRRTETDDVSLGAYFPRQAYSSEACDEYAKMLGIAVEAGVACQMAHTLAVSAATMWSIDLAELDGVISRVQTMYDEALSQCAGAPANSRAMGFVEGLRTQLDNFVRIRDIRGSHS